MNIKRIAPILLILVFCVVLSLTVLLVQPVSADYVPPGIVIDFNGSGTGTTAIDVGPNHWNGTMGEQMSFSTLPNGQQAFNLVSSGRGITITATGRPALNLTGDAYWIVDFSRSNDNSRMDLFNKNYLNEYEIIAETDDTISFYMMNTQYKTISKLATPGSYHYVTIVRNDAAKQLYFYENGSYVETINYTGTITASTDSTIRLGSTATVGQRTFDGQVLVFKEGNTSLNASQVYQDYRNEAWRAYSSNSLGISTLYNTTQIVGTYNFPVTLLYPTESTVTVNYNITDGTAKKGVNFNGASSGTLTFNAGDVTKYIAIPIVNPGKLYIDPGYRTFGITLYNCVGVSSDNLQATVRINNNPGLVFSFDDYESMPSLYDNFTPLSLKYGVPYTYFLSKPTILTGDDITKLHYMRDVLGVDIEAHTFTHTKYESTYLASHTPPEWIDQEIIPDKAYMDSLGFHTTVMAFPGGSSTPELDQAILPYFNLVRGTTQIDGPANNPDANGNAATAYRYFYFNSTQRQMGSFPVYSSTTMAVVTSSFYPDIDAAYKNYEVMGIYGHLVYNDTSPVGTDTLAGNVSSYKALIQYAIAHNMSFYTMDQLIPEPDISFDAASYAGTEGDDITIPISLSYYISDPVTVSLIGSGSAVSGVDYSMPSTVTIPAGQTTANVVIHLKSDGTTGENKQFNIILSNPQNATLGVNSSCTVTKTRKIISNPPQIQPDKSNITADGQDNITLTVYPKNANGTQFEIILLFVLGAILGGLVIFLITRHK